MPYLAPAGTPVTISDVLHGISRAARGDEVAGALVDTLSRLSGLPRAWPVSSGRAAMTVILRAMRRTATDRERDEVIVPAYTCYSVPAAIKRAGLKPRLVDIDPATLSPDVGLLAEADYTHVLAVVSSNLYGLPNDLPAIESICRERGVWFLDDAAQALGASIAGRPAGAFGDAGLYSFDKGKIISTMQGGAIVSGAHALASEIASETGAMPSTTLAESVANVAKLAIYSVFLRPALYGIVRALPFTGLGHTVYDTRFPITRLSPPLTAVAARLLARLDALAASRHRNAAALRSALRVLPGIDVVDPLPGAVPAYARFPLRVPHARRASLIAALVRAGIGATASYPHALADVPEVRARLPANQPDTPAARAVAAAIVTLPTHAYCPPDFAGRVRDAVIACVD